MKRYLLAILVLTGCAEDGESGSTGAVATDVVERAVDVAQTPDDGPEIEPDEGPVEPPFDPRANVFVSNPIDDPNTVEVTLSHITSDDHSLVGEFANVRNCLPLDDGEKIQADVGLPLPLVLCTPSYSALPGEDGTYLHVQPPEDHGVTDDAFAEVMMYHHMQRIHDYFSGEHGLKDLDYPLEAMVNIQALVDSSFCTEWTSINNAAFLSDGAAGFLGIDFGLTGPAIVFGQGSDRDFSYDADVIYHEYTHAMIGATRLNALFPDDQGINLLAGALNEAYADYFAATLAEDSVVGNYALGAIGPQEICGFSIGGSGVRNSARDLTEDWSCPGDLTGEVHADGEIFGSALWAIREALGPEKADAVILDAVVGVTQATGFDLAVQATLDQANITLSSDDAALVEKAFADRGLIDCQRVLTPEQVGARGLRMTWLSLGQVGGAEGSPWGDYVPGFVQFVVELPVGVTEVVVTIEGGGDGPIDAVWKPGPEPVKYNVTPTSVNGHDGFKIVAMDAPEGDFRSVRLAGTCLSQGKWTFALHNKGGDFGIRSMSVKTSTEPVDNPNFDTPCTD